MPHAYHEQGALTLTVYLASSWCVNPFACIAAGIGCLWQPLPKVALMKRQCGTVEKISAFV